MSYAMVVLLLKYFVAVIVTAVIVDIVLLLVRGVRTGCEGLPDWVSVRS